MRQSYTRLSPGRSRSSEQTTPNLWRHKSLRRKRPINICAKNSSEPFRLRLHRLLQSCTPAPREQLMSSLTQRRPARRRSESTSTLSVAGPTVAMILVPGSCPESLDCSACRLACENDAEEGWAVFRGVSSPAFRQAYERAGGLKTSLTSPGVSRRSLRSVCMLERTDWEAV